MYLYHEWTEQKFLIRYFSVIVLHESLPFGDPSAVSLSHSYQKCFSICQMCHPGMTSGMRRIGGMHLSEQK